MERQNDKRTRPHILMTKEERQEFIEQYKATRNKNKNFITPQEFIKKTNSRI